MFSKISRYRNEPDEVTADAKGRVLASKRFRLLPETEGTFVHTIEEGDRLDHLAFKYYRQPRSWWQIADANPEVISPQALLGNEPVETIELFIVWPGPAPPWAALLQFLKQERGILEARLGSNVAKQPNVAYTDGTPAFTVNDATLVSTLQNLTDFLRPGGEPGVRITEAELLSLLHDSLIAQGVSLSGTLSLDVVEINRWRVLEEETDRLFTFQLDETTDQVLIYNTTFVSSWAITVTFSETVSSEAAIIQAIEDFSTDEDEDRRFAVSESESILRIGQSIVIPPISV